MKLSPEKQKKFVLTLLVVALIAVGLWYFLINGQQNQKQANERSLNDKRGQIEKKKKEILTEQSNREQAKVYLSYIASMEEQMPKGTAETWLEQKMRELAGKQKFELSNTILQPADKQLSEFRFADQPYKLVGMRLDFKAEFNQIGKFIEDIENNMPLMEVDELVITSGSEVAPHVHTVSMRVSMVVRS